MSVAVGITRHGERLSRLLAHWNTRAVVSAAAFIIVYVAQLIFGGWWLETRSSGAALSPLRHRAAKKKRTDLFVRRAASELLRNWTWIPDDVSAS